MNSEDPRMPKVEKKSIKTCSEQIYMTRNQVRNVIIHLDIYRCKYNEYNEYIYI